MYILYIIAPKLSSLETAAKLILYFIKREFFRVWLFQNLV